MPAREPGPPISLVCSPSLHAVPWEALIGGDLDACRFLSLLSITTHLSTSMGRRPQTYATLRRQSLPKCVRL